jgi:hypothetical protein
MNPTYFVEPSPFRPGRWRILRIDAGQLTGPVIADHYKNRRAAMTTAGLLAGWAGTVVLIKRRPSADRRAA